VLQLLDTSNALLVQLSSAIYHCEWSNARTAHPYAAAIAHTIDNNDTVHSPPVPAVYKLRRETESPGFTSTVSLEPVERSSWLCGLRLSNHAVIQHPDANTMR
jgi:hypothetical protein